MMTMTALQNYHDRMQRVLDYIDHNLDGELSLETLAGIAAFSKFHFHRQLTATFGVAVHRYVQMLRMKRASHRLAFRKDDTVTDIALDAGFEVPEAFGRSFKQIFGQTPSAFREAPNWAPWLAAFEPSTKARTNIMKDNFSADRVSIVEVPDTTVALMEHRGDPAKIGDTIRRFIAWRKSARLNPARHATYNIFHTDPLTTPPSESHIDLCAATDLPIAALGEGVDTGLIPAGRCAVLRLVGSGNNLETGFTYLYREWLPESGEEMRDFPPYCQRVSFFPDVPEHEALTDLFLPLR
jgi:AraC family transcriptional regulator